METELAEAKGQLEQAEEERKALLLREAQAQDKAPTEPPKTSHGETEWNQMCGLIRERAQLPGVNTVLAEQISTTLDLLRKLCGQLPADPQPRPPSTAEANTPPKSPCGGGNNNPAATTGSSSGLAAKPPVVLGPHGQRLGTKLDESATAAAAAVKVPTEEVSDKSGGNQAAAAASATAKSDQPPADDKEDEEFGGDEGEEMAVDDLINLLPQRHRSRLRDAVRQRESEHDDEEENQRARNRERSPRPTKVGADKDL